MVRCRSKLLPAPCRTPTNLPEKEGEGRGGGVVGVIGSTVVTVCNLTDPSSSHLLPYVSARVRHSAVARVGHGEAEAEGIQGMRQSCGCHACHGASCQSLRHRQLAVRAAEEDFVLLVSHELGGGKGGAGGSGSHRSR